MKNLDAVVVGARCGGSVVAGKLASEGWKVLMIDKARFPSDTVSTHVMFPNTMAKFESLGILERLRDKHDIPSFTLKWRIIGYELWGDFTPVQGHSRGTSVRRVALDKVLIDWAIDNGVQTRFGERVEALIGSGVDGDPVRGVVLDGGDEVHARWVIGADGRASTVASLLGLEEKKPMAGDMAYLFSYWRGLPRAEFGLLDVKDSRLGLMRNPCEDGIEILSLAGPPEMTRGSKEDRERRYAEGVRSFSDIIEPSLLDKAERVADLVVVPETMMRGFYRQPNGLGWVLVGDAGHFKHPGTAQGISDAVEQAVFVADSLAGADVELEGFSLWRRERSKDHYEWSFAYGNWPVAGFADAYLNGLSSDTAATQDWIDTFTRLRSPTDVNTPERLGRWMSTPA